MSTVGFKTLTGSFSRYWNEILKYFFQKILPKYVENEISIHKLCPQSVLKHSLVHFQGVAMKF